MSEDRLSHVRDAVVANNALGGIENHLDAGILLGKVLKLTGQLTESQAREAILCEALETKYTDRHGNIFRNESYCETALDLPHDDTALRAMIAEAKREVLEDAASRLSACAWPTVISFLRNMAQEIKP